MYSLRALQSAWWIASVPVDASRRHHRCFHSTTCQPTSQRGRIPAALLAADIGPIGTNIPISEMDCIDAVGRFLPSASMCVTCLPWTAMGHTSQYQSPLIWNQDISSPRGQNSHSRIYPGGPCRKEALMVALAYWTSRWTHFDALSSLRRRPVINHSSNRTGVCGASLKRHWPFHICRCRRGMTTSVQALPARHRDRYHNLTVEFPQICPREYIEHCASTKYSGGAVL